nr:PREDICTED: myosin light chain kinase 2, skeletal/cardiac muscle [Latimeria chalumnae]|eukprot:XP_006008762.1 PREDICTED: myosin light chain kinase 2, skeletal/cardiac muscle [Latimeria chalumnae]
MGSVKRSVAAPQNNSMGSLNVVEVKLDCLSRKVDKLAAGQEKLLKWKEELFQRAGSPETLNSRNYERQKQRGEGFAPYCSPPGGCECGRLGREILQVLGSMAHSYGLQNQKLGCLEKQVMRMQEMVGSLVARTSQPGSVGSMKGAAVCFPVDGVLASSNKAPPKDCRMQPESCRQYQSKQKAKDLGKRQEEEVKLGSWLELEEGMLGNEETAKEADSTNGGCPYRSPFDIHQETEVEFNQVVEAQGRRGSFSPKESLETNCAASKAGGQSSASPVEHTRENSSVAWENSGDKKEMEEVLAGAKSTPPKTGWPTLGELTTAQETRDITEIQELCKASSEQNIDGTIGGDLSSGDKEHGSRAGNAAVNWDIKDGEVQWPTQPEPWRTDEARQPEREGKETREGGRDGENTAATALGGDEEEGVSTADKEGQKSNEQQNSLAVESAYALPSLRHIQSCPESLQRFEEKQKKTRGWKAMSGVSMSESAEFPGALESADTNPKAAAGTKGAKKKSSKNPTREPAGSQKNVDSSSIPGTPEGRGRPEESAHPEIEVQCADTEEHTTVKQTKPEGNQLLKVIDDVPPPPAPFAHRIVSVKTSPVNASYIINTRQILGGGRFGRVHKCSEKGTGLKLAAKILKTRSPKEKEAVRNEIQVMNQLSHSKLIQLYDAFESRTETILVLEYVFDKKQTGGAPENILCVSHSGHQIKIIDFGLARRYKPREKLKVSFGTPEFLAPEIVNFDFVSFPTDMWSLGVIVYMLLSGLSPFLGEEDSETLNNVVIANWYFDEEAFENISQEAKDFISNLLIKEKR